MIDKDTHSVTDILRSCAMTVVLVAYSSSLRQRAKICVKMLVLVAEVV